MNQDFGNIAKHKKEGWGVEKMSLFVRAQDYHHKGLFKYNCLFEGLKNFVHTVRIENRKNIVQAFRVLYPI